MFQIFTLTSVCTDFSISFLKTIGCELGETVPIYQCFSKWGAVDP